MERCYWCGNKATSKEHVPPKCLFPEQKDIKEIFDVNFRKNLITVPSCDEHNLVKSNDDEYLMAVLTGRVGNNGIAYVHNATKVKRARYRNKNLIKVMEEGVVRIGEKLYPVELIWADNQRLIHSFEAIGRALYFYEFNKVLDGECIIIADIFIDYDKQNQKNVISKRIELLKKEQPFWKTTLKGDNPEIFLYQFSPIDGFGASSLYLRFYRTIEVYVLFKENIEKKMSKSEKDKYKKAMALVKEIAQIYLGDI